MTAPDFVAISVFLVLMLAVSVILFMPAGSAVKESRSQRRRNSRMDSHESLAAELRAIAVRIHASSATKAKQLHEIADRIAAVGSSPPR